MDSFFKKYKLLISTEAKYKNGIPHILVTGIDHCTQNLSSEVNFNYETVCNREDTYHDVIGFYYTSQYSNIDDFNIQTMIQWVKYLGKNLICVVETTDSLIGWIFEEKEFNISMTEININTINDVNYDIWFDSNSNFWNPTDFLMDGERLDPEDNVENTDEIILAIQDVRKVQSDMVCGFNTLIDTVQSLIQTITENNK